MLLNICRGASTTDVDTQGNLPLHRACATGRAQNAVVLLKHAEVNSEYNVDLLCNFHMQLGFLAQL